MDISALSAEEFDAIAWINATLKNSNDQKNKEAVVSSLVGKLQLYVQQVNLALEETSQQVLASMPCIMADAKNLQNEAAQLKSKMSEIQNDIFQVHKETSACMSNLERLDTLKTRLQVAKEGLQESDGWGRLVAELDDLFEQNDMKKACEKLKTLQKSLVAQIGLPGQSEREAQLEGFKNRLEALASVSVVQCFTNGDIEQAKYFVEIFTSIDRSTQLVQYYLTVQKRMLQQQWSDFVELSQNSGSSAFLREFYDQLVEYSQKQLKWCGTVFGAGHVHTPITVLIELLPNLQPTRETAINACLKRNDDKLTSLQDFSAANVHFGRSFVDIFESNSERIDAAAMDRFAAAVFDYFHVFFGQAASFEQQWLATRLSELSLAHATASESVAALGNANSKIFDWCDETVGRSAAITQNCGLPTVVVVLNDFLKTVLDKFKKAQQQLHASQGREYDWILLQSCISLLHNIGDFRLKLADTEQHIIQAALDKHKRIEAGDKSATYVCANYRISSTRESHDFKRLVTNAHTISSFDKQDGIFATIYNTIKPICEYVHDTLLASIFAPIENQLKAVQFDQDRNELGGNDLPDYSFAPQEFITMVGQYLLTLPQHLEPLLLTPSHQLKSALELCDDRYGRGASTNEACADILLSLVADECCAMYAEKIIKTSELSAAGAKQLACDIEYLGSVLDELGLSSTQNLQQMITLLRAPADNYLALSAGCDPRLVTTIRQMRKILSKD